MTWGVAKPLAISLSSLIWKLSSPRLSFPVVFTGAWVRLEGWGGVESDCVSSTCSPGNFPGHSLSFPPREQRGGGQGAVTGEGTPKRVLGLLGWSCVPSPRGSRGPPHWILSSTQVPRLPAEGVTWSAYLWWNFALIRIPSLCLLESNI